MSFFDDGEETAPRPSSRTTRSRADDTATQPRPRRPQGSSGSFAPDQHTVVVRRRAAAGIGVLLLIAIVLIVNGCLKSEKAQALKNYNQSVSQLARESDEQVSHPLFSTLPGAAGKSALSVEEQVDQLRLEAQNLASRARSLSVPSEMTSAQRNLLLALDLRAEGLTKLAALLPTVLGGQDKQAGSQIAGNMENYLASDVIYSQRVAPLIQQTLASAGIHGRSTASTRFLANVGWLEPSTAQARISGQANSGGQNAQAVTGNHGSALKGVSVGSNTLEAEPGLNHISGGGSPTFTVQVENSGESPETNVKVDVTVTAAGKQLRASNVIEKTEPGKTTSVQVPVTGVPVGVAAKIEVYVEGVPGENDLENNKGTYLAIFGK